MIRVVAAAMLACAATAQTPYKAGDPGVTPPVLVKKVDPMYTPAAMNNRVEGVVVLQAVIDRKGRARQITIAKSLDRELDKSAVKALEDWRFTPAAKDGKPVDFMFALEMAFDLRGGRRGPVYGQPGVVDPGLTNPVIVKDVKPAFPRRALYERNLKVEVEGIIEADGVVTSVRVLKSIDPDVDSAAMAAFLSCRFKPATREGVPVAMRAVMEYSFYTR